MYQSIIVENYRGFERFELAPLARVNLLVGKNNCGKTALLEAIQWLHAGHIGPALRSLLRRGEYFESDSTARIGSNVVEVDARQLFFGRSIPEGGFLKISGDDRSVGLKHVGGVVAGSGDQNGTAGAHRATSAVRDEARVALESPRNVLEAWPNGSLVHANGSDNGAPAPEEVDSILGLSRRGGIGPIGGARDLLAATDGSTAEFLMSGGPTVAQVVEALNDCVLTPDQSIIEEAMRIAYPEFEAIAPICQDRHAPDVSGGRANVFVRARDRADRVPIGTLGDGVWRMLGLAVGLIRSRGGVFLVDEIDRSLHFTVIEPMWRFVLETAERLDVQVFATGHGRECYECFGEVLRGWEEAGQAISPDLASMHRIEPRKQKSVEYEVGHLIAVAKMNVEVR